MLGQCEFSFEDARKNDEDDNAVETGVPHAKSAKGAKVQVRIVVQNDSLKRK